MSPLFLTDLFAHGDLDAAIADGWVRPQDHPTLPLRILNYTEKTQFAQNWTPVTEQCRGLIYDTTTGRVVARPFRKFHNYGSPQAGVLDLTAPVAALDKADGSLGILYPTGRGTWAVATRGSFTSDQAVHATRVWQEKYANRVAPYEGETWLFEIVYPANRIVLDYGGMDDLVLLGAVANHTGRVISPSALYRWPGPRVFEFDHKTLADAVAAPPRPNAEGLVVRFGDGRMVKLKQEDYVLLHRTLFGLNARVVWERLGSGATAADICDGLPDEFHPWVKATVDGLLRDYAKVLAGAWAEHTHITISLPEGWERRDYAQRAAKSKFRPWLFMILDDKDPRPAIWKTLRPSADNRPTTTTVAEVAA
ncbi:RNA ligase [Nocardiopsis sp. CT-R113]|uniref:RNA ligase n=1 Tax=Nocardiopsis codii TaxID=3065942 RepID=A0ABU7KD17_9ACTN|nr:RNA ligase [Nocardiopsis sp. CT-R113]MEE2040133.1 RNA ligase [Nocardiopsis sp. CT-R113]